MREDLDKLGRCVARINKFDVEKLKVFMRSILPSKKDGLTPWRNTRMSL